MFLMGIVPIKPYSETLFYKAFQSDFSLVRRFRQVNLSQNRPFFLATITTIVTTSSVPVVFIKINYLLFFYLKVKFSGDILMFFLISNYPNI